MFTSLHHIKAADSLSRLCCRSMLSISIFRQSKVSHMRL